MSRRKSKYTPKAFESKGETYRDSAGKLKNDTSANIYESMLTSPAFLTMTVKQRLLYIYAKSQYYGHRKPGRDHPDIEQLQGDDLFYLSWAAVQEYGLYKDNSHSGFYKDMRALIEHGFIEKVSSGAAQRTKTIYRFSGKWRTWNDTS